MFLSYKDVASMYVTWTAETIFCFCSPWRLYKKLDYNCTSGFWDAWNCQKIWGLGSRSKNDFDLLYPQFVIYCNRIYIPTFRSKSSLIPCSSIFSYKRSIERVWSNHCIIWTFLGRNDHLMHHTKFQDHPSLSSWEDFNCFYHIWV